MWGALIRWKPTAWVVKEFTQGRTKEKFFEYTTREQQAGHQRRDCLPGGGAEPQ